MKSLLSISIFLLFPLFAKSQNTLDIDKVWSLHKVSKPIYINDVNWIKAGSEAIDFTCIYGDCQNGYGIGIGNDRGRSVRYQIEGNFMNGKINGAAIFQNANNAYVAGYYTNGNLVFFLEKDKNGLVKIKSENGRLNLEMVKRHQSLAFSDFKQCDCLIKTSAEREYTYNTSKEVVIDVQGNTINQAQTNTGSTTVDVWQNKCNTTVFLKGIKSTYSWSNSKNYYDDVSVAITPGNVVLYDDISPVFEDVFGNYQYLGQYVSKNSNPIRETNYNISKSNTTPPKSNLAITKGTKLEINSTTNTTNIKVKKGDKVYFEATGKIVLGMFSGSAGPDGIKWSPDWTYRTDINYGALMGRIGKESKWILVGSTNVIVANQDGILELMINDTDPSDNSGSFIVDYSINKPLPNMPKNVNEVNSIPSKVQPQNSISTPVKSENLTKPGPTDGPMVWFDVKPFLPKRYTGYITNTTVNKTSYSSNMLSLNNDGSYRLQGSVDNVNLAGKWNLVGHEITKGQRKMIQFVGDLDLGGIGNIPRGTVAPFTMLVEITKNGMKGTYEVGVFKYASYKQYGTVDLR